MVLANWPAYVALKEHSNNLMASFLSVSHMSEPSLSEHKNVATVVKSYIYIYWFVAQFETCKSVIETLKANLDTKMLGAPPVLSRSAWEICRYEVGPDQRQSAGVVFKCKLPLLARARFVLELCWIHR